MRICVICVTDYRKLTTNKHELTQIKAELDRICGKFVVKG